MAAPEDSAEVLSALRLGWYMAEVRGRNRPGGPVPPAESLPNRQGHMLPLRIERTLEELRIEAQVVLRRLAHDLGVDAVTINGLYQLDAHAQDFLSAQSGTQAAAYQLGRGLAEVYWALDPSAGCDPPTPDCWVYLLRKRTLTTAADATVP
jgi:hypothetical protein